MAKTEHAQEEEDREGMARARIGRVLASRWTIESLLGMGGTAAVYAATHRNSRRVAIKILHPELAGRARVRRRFLSEGYTANKTGHPGAVAILDDGEDGDTVFLVLELLQGRTLAAQLTSDGPLPPSEAARVGIDVLDVLAAAHDRGILHRDVKPSNIFLTDSGGVKVLDFGAARLRESEDFVTRSGTVLGTPAFMAPEVAAGRVEDTDVRSDVWSVGATLFQALTGITVHQARTSNEAIVAAATRPAPPISSLRGDLPAALANVIDRSLEFEQGSRWPNARAMQAALRAADVAAAGKTRGSSVQLVPDPGQTTVHELATPPARTTRRRRFVAAGAGAVLAALLAIGVIAGPRAPNDAPEPARPRVTEPRPAAPAIETAEPPSSNRPPPNDPSPPQASSPQPGGAAPLKPPPTKARRVPPKSESRRPVEAAAPAETNDTDALDRRK